MISKIIVMIRINISFFHYEFLSLLSKVVTEKVATIRDGMVAIVKINITYMSVNLIIFIRLLYIKSSKQVELILE